MNYKKRRLSVAFISPWFMPETYAGAEQQTIRLASKLKINNVEAFILSPKIKKDTPSENFVENILVKRFKVNNLPNLGGKYFFSFIVWSIKLIFWLLKNSNKFDVIHVIHGRLHSIPAVFAAKWLGKPILIKLGRGGKKHFDINVVRDKKIVGSFFSKYLLKNVSGWIANSNQIVEDLKTNDIKSRFIYKIYNGIDIKNFKINKFRKNKTFIVIGRLDEEKLCDQIISVFSKLPENLNVKLIFLGDGECRSDLEKMTNQLNQSHRIFLKGVVKNVNDYLINCDFYLSASSSEGMSNALLESMALGVPAIVSNVSGVDEIIFDNQNGFVFEPGDEKTFYEKIIKAINYSEEKYINMSRMASQHILKNFSIELIADKHVKLYKSLFEDSSFY